MNEVASFPGLPRFLFFGLRSHASVYYIERKPKNKKRGRPGNEAMNEVHERYILHGKELGG